MPLYLVTKPVATILSLADAKTHLRVPHTDDDDDIQAMIDAAVAHLDGRDGVLNRALADQTWNLKIDCFPYYCRGYGAWLSREIRLPLPPLIEVVSVKYIDDDGDEQTFDDGSYYVSGVGDVTGGRITLTADASWPDIHSQWPEPVTVQFRAGYIDASESPPTIDVPAPIVSAIKLIVGHLYRNRETVVVGDGAVAVEVPQTAEWLLAPYKVYA